VNRINIIGGGVKNTFLCQTTADVTGIKVLAGPVEATVLGNLIMQMVASDEIKDLADARRIISESFIPDEYMPLQSSKAENAYERYKKLIHQ
jgi:sugar (pentulose or hexulose) kinase